MYIIFDIGGTNIKYSVLDDKFFSIASSKVKTPKTNLDDFANALLDIINEYNVDNNLKAISTCIPGQIDIENGHIINGASFPFLDDTPIYDLFRVDKSIPIIIENDAKAAALGEHWKGNLEGVTNGMVITLGTGLGGGIILNNQLYRGSNNEAGELSFLNMGIADQSVVRDPIVMRASGYFMVERLKAIIGDPNMNGIDVFEILKKSDNEDLWAIFNDFITVLAHLIIDVQCMFDFEKILIGGGLSSQEMVIDGVKDKIKLILETDDRFRVKPIVERTFYENDANKVGMLYKLRAYYNLEGEM